VSDVHPGIRVNHDGPVLTLTLANPESRNAQTPSLWLALAQVGESLPPEVRVVVIRAEGASFSAGLHRQMLAPGGMPGEPDILELATAEGLDETIAGFQRGFAIWRSIPAVVVAAVQGHAVGAGFQLALAADLRILADDAQLCMREAQLGLVPDLGGTGPLVHLVGYARALEICSTGRFVGAREASDIGLATAVVPRDDLESATADLVAALLATPEGSLRALKPLLVNSIHAGVADQLAAERAAQAGLLRALAERARG
jgi:enoyl-CoA hydratase/carnithine racemase